MTNAVLQGFNLSKSEVDVAAALDALIDVRQSMVHAHFPMFNGLNADGSWKAMPFVHQTQPATPYFPLALGDALWKRGQLLLMTWGTQNLNVNGVRRRMEPADVLAGKYDSYLRSWAAESVRWRHPWAIALNPEFNGTWSTWYMQPADFVKVWRYIVLLMRGEGATNITWCWIPNIVSSVGSTLTTAQDKLAAYWPGDDVVDIAGWDGYNWGAPWLTFEQVIRGGVGGLGDTYGTIRQIAPTKPLVIGEFASTVHPTDPNSKAAWIRAALEVIPVKYPEIMGISWFGVFDSANPNVDWSLKSTDGTARAYEDSVEEGPYVLGGSFTMPPDLEPLKPFTETVLQGDPIAELVQARATIAALQDKITTSTAEYERLLAELDALRVEAESTAATAQAALADAQAAARTLVQLGQAQPVSTARRTV